MHTNYIWYRCSVVRVHMVNGYGYKLKEPFDMVAISNVFNNEYRVQTMTIV